MNNLGLYIREALEDKNEIYLSGIGTFKKERVPAYFDEISDKFIPPSLTINLKAKQISDSNLIDFLAEKEVIDLDAAQLKLAEALKDIEGKEEFILENLGKLKNNNGVFEFAYLPAQIESRISEYETISEGEVLTPLDEPVGEVEESSPVLENGLEYEEQEVSSKRWLWPVIGTAICVVLAAIWFLNPILNSKQPKNKETISGVQTKNNQVAENLVREKDTSEVLIVESPVQDSTNFNASGLAIKDAGNISNLIKEPQGKFEIIIAAFKTMEEAEEYVARTNSKGYQVYILKNNRANNLNKISFSSFKNEEDAEIALAKVRKELNAEAWLWENKRSNINN